MFRLAEKEDLKRVMEIIGDAKRFLKLSGSTQWNGPKGYPDRFTLEKDIEKRNCFLYEEDGYIYGLGVFSGMEPEYENKGIKWLTDGLNYMTIHRIATSDDARGKGVAKKLMLYAVEVAKERGNKSIRIDTHPKNTIMQNMLKGLGYTELGIMVYESIPVEPERIIYEKLI
jgi:ribosomal protein S18 acetylase RimI-like enzyme